MEFMEQQGPGPLCPRQGFPGATDPVHAAFTRAGNQAYDASAPWRDEDGEYPGNVDASVAANAVTAAANADDGMRLYRTTASTPRVRGVFVEAWFFMCPICGQILPAQSRPLA